MGKDRFELTRTASPEEVAEYLTTLAAGLKRGEVSLESGERRLRLTPAPDLTLEIKVAQKGGRGAVSVEIGWKRHLATKMAELRVGVGSRRGSNITR